MDTVSENKFKDTLKDCVEKVISQHNPLKGTRRNGKDFVVISAEDWEQEQETLSDAKQYLNESSCRFNGYTHSNKAIYRRMRKPMRSLVFAEDTWTAYDQLHQDNRKLPENPCKILKEMLRGDSKAGIGKPEPLKHNLSGL